MPEPVSAWIAAAFVAGTWVYCVLQIIAARRYRAVVPPALGKAPPISVLKPLHGLDEGLEENLRSFFTQDYPQFELLFAARYADDPCWGVVEQLRREYPAVPVTTIVTGEPPFPNAKVWSLHLMTQQASYELLAMADSDIRSGEGLLRTLAAEFQDPAVGVITCPYRAAAGQSFWSRLEALGMSTEFWGTAFTARLVEGGVHFAIGPTCAARKAAVETAGGWLSMGDYLAEDFVLGQRASAAGMKAMFSSFIVDHRIGSQNWRTNFRHRIRWNRSTRRSRPAGYAGQVFTNPLPVALLAAPWLPFPALALAMTALLRAVAAHSVASYALSDRSAMSRWYWIPIQDVLSFAFWVAGFWGTSIEWRGRKFELTSKGTLTGAPPGPVR